MIGANLGTRRFQRAVSAGGALLLKYRSWRYSSEVNRKDPNWQLIWNIVNKNKQALIQYWDSHNDEIVKRFDSRYDGLF